MPQQAEHIRGNGIIQILTSVPAIPKSWYQAAGLLRHQSKTLKAHAKKIRKEWTR